MAPTPRRKGKTPLRTVRVDDDLWLPFGDAVEGQGEPDRSAVLRQFIAWYLREPGAKMPKRPDQDRGTSGAQDSRGPREMP